MNLFSKTIEIKIQGCTTKPSTLIAWSENGIRDVQELCLLGSMQTQAYWMAIAYAEKYFNKSILAFGALSNGDFVALTD